MRRLLQTALLSLLCTFCIGQDTTWIQTFTFDSITTRTGVFPFPDGSDTYRKILMHQTLKCDPQTSADGLDCGEVPQLTAVELLEHTGLLDSIALQHPTLLVGATAPALITTSPTLALDTFAVNRSLRVIDSTLNESFHTLSAMDAVDLETFNNANGATRSQFVYTGTELVATGMQPGNIAQVRLNVNFPGDPLGRVTIGMKNSASALFEQIDVADIQVVFDHAHTFTSGINTFVLETPFAWDGSSNILLDLSFSEPQGVNRTRLFAQEGVLPLGGRTSEADHFLRLNDDHLAVNAQSLSVLNDEVTIMCWLYGEQATTSADRHLLEAADQDGRLILGVSLPDENGVATWYAGGDIQGADSIQFTPASASLFGQWNHWAFTKNTNTGVMNIYVNGVLAHSGSTRTRPLAGIDTFVLGASIDRINGYAGRIDEFALFTQELDQAAIQQAMRDVIDNGNPAYANLTYYYDFNESLADSVVVDQSLFSNDALLIGTTGRRAHAGTDLLRQATSLTTRPDVSFVQGNYISHLEDSLHFLTHPKQVTSVVEFQLFGNNVLPVDTTWAIAAGFAFTFDTAGVAVDSAAIGGAVQVNGSINFFGPSFPEVIRHELGRNITPFGMGLSLGDGFTWIYDVTDFAYVLQDSVELRAGNQQELIDLRFELIEGIPPREVLRIRQPWGARASYSYSALDNDQVLSATTYQVDPLAEQWVMRSRLTGFGMEGDSIGIASCCESTANTHFLLANGQTIDSWQVWTNERCALNPVFPQGGAWADAREGWCPGDQVEVHETNLTTQVLGGAVDLDYDISDVPLTDPGQGDGTYVTHFELVEYNAPVHSLDAEIYQVLKPSTADSDSRMNPICADAVLILRNAGDQILNTVEFTYSVSGGVAKTFTWNGALASLESETVVLPIPDASFWSGNGGNVFTARILSANGSVDDYAENDTYTSPYALPAVYNQDFVLVLKTNNRPQENTWTIKDIQGDTVASNGLLAVNTTHFDTISLPPGCYTFELLDTGNDGLSYGSDPAAGTGFCRFKEIGGNFFELFEPDFGRSIQHAFGMSIALNTPTIESSFDFSLYPNPAHGSVTMHVTHLEGEALVQVRNVTGAIIQQRLVELQGDNVLNIDMQEHAEALYFVQLIHAGNIYTKKLILAEANN